MIRALWGLGLAAGIVGALLLLAGCGDPPAAPQAEVRPVKTQVVHYESVDGLAQLVGEIRPHYESDLGFKIGGRMLTRQVELGNLVHKGQVLATLDERDQLNQVHVAEANVASARATLAQAAAEDRRQSALFRDGWVSRSALDVARQASQSAEAGLAAAQANLRLARDQLGYVALIAPEDGTITALDAQAGQVVAAGQAVVRLARLDQRDAVFSVAESAIAGVALGGEVEVALLDAPTVRTRGAVTEIAPVADATTRTYTVKVALPGGTEAPPGGIEVMRFGMSVVGRFGGAERQAAVLPGVALAQQDGKPALWVVDAAQQTVALHPVALYRVEADRILVGQGVEEGALVVTAGVQSLRPGQKVRLGATAIPGGAPR